MLGPYWVPSRENLVTHIERRCILEALLADYSVVVDATNFRCEMIKDIAKNCGVDYEIKDFTNVSVEECIERDKNRLKEEQVGEEVIRNMAKKYGL